MATPWGTRHACGGHIARHLPGARTLLELGCGSGQVLAGLQGLTLTGIDRSPQMLARARTVVPGACLVEADMTSFALGQRFDVVICVFDTVNHLPSLDAWHALFARAAQHLKDGGIFVFDVNTLGTLRRLGERPAWRVELEGAAVTQEVEWLGGGLVIWHVQIDEEPGRRHEQILELGVELAVIEAALRGDFELLERSDGEGAPPTDDSVRAFYAWRRRPRGAAGDRGATR